MLDDTKSTVFVKTKEDGEKSNKIENDDIVLLEPIDDLDKKFLGVVFMLFVFVFSFDNKSNILFASLILSINDSILDFPENKRDLFKDLVKETDIFLYSENVSLVKKLFYKKLIFSIHIYLKI